MDVENKTIVEEPNTEEFNRIEKRGFWKKVKELWDKTIFSDWIKDYREEKQFKAEIRKQAKKEALFELKDRMVEKYKKDELDKMMGVKKKSDWMSKIGKELQSMGENASKNLSSMNGGMGGGNVGGNISEMLGVQKSQPPVQRPVRQYVYVRKHKKKKKKKQHRQYQQSRQPVSPTFKQKQESYEEKIKRMMQ